jgi:hypothetical protein
MAGRDGKIKATAGADVNISVIEVATQNALFASALIGVASLAACALVTLLIVRWVAVPIEGLKADALRIAAGDRAPPARLAGPREVSRLREALAELATHLMASMRQAWSDTLSLDRARNGQALEQALAAPGPVTLVEHGRTRVIWTPKDNSLEARLEHRAMTLLAERFAAEPKLASAWEDIVVPMQGDVRVEREVRG